MTTATTRQLIRRDLYEQIPGLGFVGTADSLVNATLTDTFVFRDETIAQNQYRGFYLYRPDLSTDDRVKRIRTVNTTTGVVTATGANYADTADLDYEVVGLIHPDELNACIERAVRRIYFEVQVPLTGYITDGDMDDSATTSWTNNGFATMEKVTTATRIFSGIRSLHTLANSANDNAQSVSVRGFSTNGGETVYASTVVHVDVGTVSFILYDVTNAANIATVESSEEGWAHLWINTSLPSGCEEVALRLNSVTTTADAYWSHALLYRAEQRIFPAPSWLDEPWKFLKLREARYRKSVSNQTNGGYNDAQSREWVDWLQPSMYSLDPLHIDANPYAIQLNKPTPRNELWIHGKRPHSDLEDLSTESSTTRAPLHMVYAYAKEEIAKVLHKRYPNDKRWNMLLGEATVEVEAETSARPEIPIQAIKRESYWRV